MTQTQRDMDTFERIDIMDPDTFVVVWSDGRIFLTDREGAVALCPEVAMLGLKPDAE